MRRATLLFLSLLPLLPLAAATADEKLISAAEKVGQLHNELLDVAGASGALDRGDRETLLAVLAHHVRIDPAIIADVDRNRDAVVLDERQRQLIDQLHRLVDTAPNAEVTITRLRAFENALMRRNDLTLDQKQPILFAAVVGRYSAEYWSRASVDPASPYYRFLNPTGTEPIGMPKWLRADMNAAWTAGVLLLPAVINPGVYLGGVGIYSALGSISALL